MSAGTRYADVAARRVAQDRVDVAIPLAQFYIQQSRLSGDLRYLGYAKRCSRPGSKHTPAIPDVLVLQATLQQSRHEFDAALATLDRALAVRPEDPQALLIRATVLRVLGRYPEAGAACEQFSQRVERAARRAVHAKPARLERPSGIGLCGAAASVAAGLAQLRKVLAVLRTGRNGGASGPGCGGANGGFSRICASCQRISTCVRPMRICCCGRGAPREALVLLQGQESFEPLLLRIAIAQQRLHDPGRGAKQRSPAGGIRRGIAARRSGASARAGAIFARGPGSTQDWSGGGARELGRAA